jgi:hypothetical protein
MVVHPICTPQIQGDPVFNPRLGFTYNIKRQTEAGADFLRIEVSTNGGSTWTQVASGSGTTSGFTTTPGAGMVPVTIPLTAYAGRSNVKIRFRFTTNGSVGSWGVALDDIAVTAQ